MNKLKVFLFSLSLAIFTLTPHTTFAAVSDPGGVSTSTTTPWSGNCIAEGDVATIRGITCLLTNIIRPIPALIVLTALGMILFAAVKVILSGSDPKAYATGMQIMLFAIVGIILLSAAWLILVLLERFTGAEITKFGIP